MNAPTPAIECPTSTTELTVADLVAEVYETAPEPERRQLIEQLLRPLSLLSLAAVAGGAFSAMRLRTGWRDLTLVHDDIGLVRPSEVAALVDHAQQVSAEVLDGLASMVGTSPALCGTAAAMLLVAIVMSRARPAVQAPDAVRVEA